MNCTHTSDCIYQDDGNTCAIKDNVCHYQQSDSDRSYALNRFLKEIDRRNKRILGHDLVKGPQVFSSHKGGDKLVSYIEHQQAMKDRFYYWKKYLMKGS